MDILLKDLTSDELYNKLSPVGVTPALARKIQAKAIRDNKWLEKRPGISEKVLKKIKEIAFIPRLKLIDKITSQKDGFARYVFKGLSPDPFEAIRIPLLHKQNDKKYIVCVSSQIGCAMGCAFCLTGRMGFIRQLATWEIVDQVAIIRALSQHPVKGVVFMGMGEPLLNYDNVIRAAKILSEPCGMAISAKAITISTAGVVPAIKKFTQEKHAFRLIVSLTSADSEIRQKLMPIESTWSTTELMEALREYHLATGERITLAWTMMSGINTNPADARKLALLIHDLPVKLDLIDVNDPTGKYIPPSPKKLVEFRDALRAEAGIPFSRRYSGGQDIHAACGMLSSKNS